MTTDTATPAKLKSGAWGARIHGRARKGDTVTITAKSGKSWQATVTAVVWQGEGVTLVATESRDRAPSAGRHRTSRGRACVTDGNCSSFGDGRSCGGYDCDGW